MGNLELDADGMSAETNGKETGKVTPLIEAKMKLMGYARRGADCCVDFRSSFG